MFEKLKGKFTTELVLSMLDLDKKMRMEVDVSDYVTERVLLIEYKNISQASFSLYLYNQ